MPTVTDHTDRTQEIRGYDKQGRRIEGGTWLVDPAMIVSAMAGIYLLVVGIVAVARTDFLASGLYDPVVVVGALARDGNAVTFFGVVALVIGIVWVIEPNSFAQWLGVTSANGWQHVIVGVFLAVSGQITPFRVTRPGG